MSFTDGGEGYRISERCSLFTFLFYFSTSPAPPWVSEETAVVTVPYTFVSNEHEHV